MRNPKKLIQFIYPAYFIVYALLAEVVAFAVLKFGFLPKYFLLDVGFIVLLAAITYLIHNRVAQAVFMSFFISLQALILFINQSLSGVFGDIFYVETVYNAADGMSAVEFSFLSVGMIILTVATIAVNIVSLILINRFILKPHGKRQAESAGESAAETQTSGKANKGRAFGMRAAVFGMIAVVGLSVFIPQSATLNANKNTAVQAGSQKSIAVPALQDNDKLLYDKQYFKVPSLKKFGFYGFYFKAVTNFIFKPGNKAERAAARSFIEAGDAGRQSEHFGTQRDNNFIVVLMESVSLIGIDQNPDLTQNLTPNLYRLQNNIPFSVGAAEWNTYSMSEYYSKSKTNASECGALSGTLPYFTSYTNTWMPLKKHQLDGALEFSLPNKLKEQNPDYITNYMIFHDVSFYGRNKLFNAAAFGFDNVLDGVGTAKTIGKKQYSDFSGTWLNDSVLFEAAKETLIPKSDKPFFTAMATMYTHGPYIGKEQGIDKYVAVINEAVSNGTWTNPMAGKKYASKSDVENFIYFQAACMDLDVMIGGIYERLAEIGAENNTTVVLYGDHETYYYDFAKKMLDLKADDYATPALYRDPMFFTGAGFGGGGKIDKFVKFFDVYATICDLAGLQYNQNMCFGESVFVDADETRVLLSSTGGVFNADIFSTDGLIDKNLVYNGLQLTPEIQDGFYASLNKTLYKSLMLRHLFESKLYAEIDNKTGYKGVIV